MRVKILVIALLALLIWLMLNPVRCNGASGYRIGNWLLFGC